MDQHAEAYPGGVVADPDRVTGRCAQCRADGCGMLDWAGRVLTGNVPRFPSVGAR